LLTWALAAVLLSRLVVWCFTLSREVVGRPLPWGVGGAFFVAALGVGCWMYAQRVRLKEAADDPNAHPGGPDRISWSGGLALVIGGGALAGTALWMFTPSPPSRDKVLRLSGHDAAELRLPLRHPGFHLLNREPPFDSYPPGPKYVGFFALAAVVLYFLSYLFFRAWRWARPQAAREAGRARTWGRFWRSLWCDLWFG